MRNILLVGMSLCFMLFAQKGHAEALDNSLLAKLDASVAQVEERSSNDTPLHILCNNLPANQSAVDKAYNDIRCSCRKESKDLIDSTGTGNMKAGNLEYKKCIIRNTENLSKDFLIEKEYSRVQFLKNLKNVEENYDRLMHGIFSQNKSCQPYCGIDMEVFSSVYMYQIQENILYAMVTFRIQNKMGMPKLSARPK